MKALNLECMPSREDIIKYRGSHSLTAQIEKTGGYVKWAKTLNILTKIEHNKLKYLEDIEVEIISGIKKVYNNSSIANKICKNGGFRYWTNKLNLTSKECKGLIGNEYEFIAKTLLESKGYKVDKMAVKCHFDLLVNNNIKIDVKMANTNIKKGHNTDIYYKSYVFRLKKIYSSCDIYMAFAVDKEMNNNKIYIIPSTVLRIKTLEIPYNSDSKYNIFKDRWDIIDKYNDFYNKIRVI